MIMVYYYDKMKMAQLKFTTEQNRTTVAAHHDCFCARRLHQIVFGNNFAARFILWLIAHLFVCKPRPGIDGRAGFVSFHINLSKTSKKAFEQMGLIW